MNTILPERIIELLIASKTKTKVCVSGVGTLLLSYMSRFPGSSSFFLEGCNLYSRQSLKRYLSNDKLEKFCSRETATVAAHQALVRAQRLLFDSVGRDYKRLGEVDMKNTLGIAINGSLSSNYEKKGRIRCFMALKQYDRMDSYHLLLNEPRGRLDEQELFSNECMGLIGQFLEAKNERLPAKIRAKRYRTADMSLELESWAEDIEPQHFQSILLPSMFVEPPLENCAVFSGAFNPFHRGHLEMYRISEKHQLVNQRPVILELALKNADKAANLNILPRLQSIVDLFDNKQPNLEAPVQDASQLMHALDERNINVLLSHAGKFVEKGLKKGVFVIGADTFTRLIDPRFYNSSGKELRRAISQFVVDDVKFLVFPRSIAGKDFPICTEQDIQFETIENWSNPISSTDIRSRHHQ